MLLEKISMDDGPGDRSRPDRKVGEIGLDRSAIQFRLVEDLDGAIDEGPSVLSGHDDGPFDLTALD